MRTRKLVAAYRMYPSPTPDACCSCGGEIHPKQRACVDLGTLKIQCERCFAAGVPFEPSLGQLRNLQGRCADCADPIPCRQLLPMPQLVGATFRCLKCACAGGPDELDDRALRESN